MKIRKHRRFYAMLVLCLLGFLIMPKSNLRAQSIAGATMKTYGSSPVLKYDEIQPLSVGDQMPAIEISNVLNYISGKIRMPAIDRKMLIIDFFATHCTSCIKALPRLDSLQKHFGDRLQIILVTRENAETVRPFFQKMKTLKNLKLPTVTSDSILSRMFPYRFISHEVWINKSGQIAAITGTEYVSSSNIEEMLAKRNVDWPIKNDFAEFDYTQPILDYNRTNSQNFSLPSRKFYSMIMGHIPNVARLAKDISDSSNETVRTYMINYPVVNMFLRAYGKKPSFPASHVVLEVREKNKLIPSSTDDWELENTFTYDAVFPAAMKESERLEKIRYDLQVFFKLKGFFEKRKVACMVLMRNSDSDSLMRELTSKVKMNDRLRPESHQKPVSLSRLLNQLNRKQYGLPFIDETGYETEMYVELERDGFSNINELSGLIKKYGLVIKNEIREVEIFILTNTD